MSAAVSPASSDEREPEDMLLQAHQWSAHRSTPRHSAPPSTGVPACSRCADTLRQLSTMQLRRQFTILSHAYSRAPRLQSSPAAAAASSAAVASAAGASTSAAATSAQLTVISRCDRCGLSLTWIAEELLQPDAIVCPTCALGEAAQSGAFRQTHQALLANSESAATTSSSSAAAGAASASPIAFDAPFPESIPRSRSRPSVPAATASSSSRPATAARIVSLADSDDEDVSILSLLHRKVVSNATKLQRQNRKQAQQTNANGAGGTKHTPIEIEDETISAGRDDAAAASFAAASSAASAAASTAPGFLPAASPAFPRSTSRTQPNLIVGRPKRKAADATAAGSNQDERGNKNQKAETGAAVPSAAPAAAASASAASASVFHLSARDVARATRAALRESESAAQQSFEDTFWPDPSANTLSAKLLRQQQLFAASRRRLDIRRSLNLEPDATHEPTPLPFKRKQAATAAADQAASAAAAAANASAAVSTAPFTLPAFFRPESAQAPYTIKERQDAIQFMIDYHSSATVQPTSGPPLPHTTLACRALCLPVLHPKNWCSVVRAATRSPADLLAASSEPAYTPATLLSHHYRRLAKLVHPDKCSFEMRESADAAFKILHAAYTTLTQKV